jgi:hypothetical protein
MEDVTEYRILSSPYKEELEALVNKALREGWRLHGSVSYNDLMWIQTVIKQQQL